MPNKLARGLVNNNPGNIRKTGDWRKWQGLAKNQSDPSFIVFETPVDGIRAIARTLITYYDKRFAEDGSRVDTVAEVIQRWAPPPENNTVSYISAVAARMGVTSDTRIDLHEYRHLRPLVEAIIKHENGSQPYTDAQIDEALRRVGVVKPQTAVAQVAHDPAVQLTSLGTAISAAAGIVATGAEIWDTLAARIDPRLLIWACVAAVAALGAYRLWQILSRRKAGVV